MAIQGFRTGIFIDEGYIVFSIGELPDYPIFEGF